MFSKTIMTVALIVAVAIIGGLYFMQQPSAPTVTSTPTSTPISASTSITDSPNLTVANPIQIPEGIVCSHNWLNIATIDNGQTNVLTSGDRDYKPVSSLDGECIVFFRVVTYGETIVDWKTKICIINYDGSGFRELTSGNYMDANPTFMRDGTNRIIFNRINYPINEIYITKLESSHGDEVIVSDPTIPEWVYSSLKDGRLFIHRFNWDGSREVFLLKPNPGGLGEYQQISMPTTNYIHKVSISPSETKITYMFDNDNIETTYSDAQIAWAEFDVENLRVYDQKLITKYNASTVEEYPKWNHDETLIIYDSDKSGDGGIHQLYAYRLSDGVEENISPDNKLNYGLSCIKGNPK